MLKSFPLFALLFFMTSPTIGADLRIANLLLSPEQKPNVEVISETPISGIVNLIAPEGWRIVPEAILAEPDQRRFVFTVAQGKPNERNVYSLSVKVRRPDGTALEHTQDVHVATAPNSNLSVTGPNDQGVAATNWDHAIPLFVTIGDHPVQIRTVWNRRQLSLLVGVENMVLAPFTGVQIAVGSVRSDKTPGELYQFLLFADETQAGRLVSLPGNLEDLPKVDVSQAFVWQLENTVWFEAAIPFAAIPAIRPGEGRELTLSFLIHDAQNKTVLDWGRICLLPNESAEKWFRWKGDSIGDKALTTPRSEWGLCSSKF